MTTNDWHCNNCSLDVHNKYCPSCSKDKNGYKKFIPKFGDTFIWTCVSCDIEIYGKDYCIKCHKNKNGENDPTFVQRNTRKQRNNFYPGNNAHSKSTRDNDDDNDNENKNNDYDCGYSRNISGIYKNDHKRHGTAEFTGNYNITKRDTDRKNDNYCDIKYWRCKDCKKNMPNLFAYCDSCFPCNTAWKCIKCKRFNSKNDTFCNICEIDCDGKDVKKNKVFGENLTCDFDKEFKNISVNCKKTEQIQIIQKREFICQTCNNKMNSDTKQCLKCKVKENIKTINCNDTTDDTKNKNNRQFTSINDIVNNSGNVGDNNTDNGCEDHLSVSSSPTFEPSTDSWF